MFARRTEKVGAAGMPLLCNVTDGGKTNKNGRVSYSAVLPHRNPLFCCIFAKGAMLVWRLRVMGAPFPDLLSPEDIFKRPTLRQGYNEFGPVQAAPKQGGDEGQERIRPDRQWIESLWNAHVGNPPHQALPYPLLAA